MHTNRHRRARRMRRRSAERREGAVMLVVMLFLFVATASAAVSVRATQAELESAGQDRLAHQARASADSAMNGTLTFLDQLTDAQAWREAKERWQQNGTTPGMAAYCDAPVDPAFVGRSLRMFPESQTGLRDGSGGPPLENPDVGETVGSWGEERHAYGFNDAREAYAVDFSDCVMVPGSVVNGRNLADPTGQPYSCAVTVRFKLRLRGNDSTYPWTLRGAQACSEPRFAFTNDVRTTVIVPGSL